MGQICDFLITRGEKEKKNSLKSPRFVQFGANLAKLWDKCDICEYGILKRLVLPILQLIAIKLECSYHSLNDTGKYSQITGELTRCYCFSWDTACLFYVPELM